MKDVKVNNPLTFGNISYSANNINQIVVEDKDGNKTKKGELLKNIKDNQHNIWDGFLNLNHKTFKNKHYQLILQEPIPVENAFKLSQKFYALDDMYKPLTLTGIAPKPQLMRTAVKYNVDIWNE